MQLTDRHIDEFIALYEKHYGVVLDRLVAMDKGIQLCRFVELVCSNNEINEYGEKDY